MNLVLRMVSGAVLLGVLAAALWAGNARRIYRLSA